MKNALLRRSLLWITTLMAVSGCKGSHRLSTQGIPEAPVGKAPVKLNSADREMRTKLQPLIECLNGALTHYEAFAPSYTEKMQRLSAPASASSFPSMDGNTFDVVTNDEGGQATLECAAKLENGANLPPAVADLDALARATAKDLRDMIGPGRQLDAYITQKAYLDDKFAKGRTLAAIVTPLLTDTNRKTHELRRLVERQNSVVRQDELAAIDKREGHSISWQAHNSMIAARRLNDSVHELYANRGLTSATVDQAIQPLKAAIDEGQALVAAHPELAGKDDSSNQPLWFAIRDALTRELAAARELRATLDSNEPESYAGQRAQTLQQHVKSLGDEFDYLIRSYNQTLQNSR